MQPAKLLHSDTAFGPWHEYTLEIRKLKFGGVLFIVEGALSDLNVAQIATRIRRRLEDNVPSERLIFVLRSREDGETRYQNLELSWDGERYYRARRTITLNQAAFSSAFDPS